MIILIRAVQVGFDDIICLGGESEINGFTLTELKSSGDFSAGAGTRIVFFFLLQDVNKKMLNKLIAK